MGLLKQNDKSLFILAGVLLALPASYWFFIDGWTTESNKLTVLINGAQALFGIYLIYYASTKSKKVN